MPVACSYAAEGEVAVVEMAEVSGLAQLPDGTRAPLTVTSRATGELVAAALEHGPTRAVLGVGGSATTDGGAGMLQALGVWLRDSDGNELEGGGAPLTALAEVDLGGLHPRIADAEIVVACDVDNPLTGPAGAAAVYGPQKGASADDVATLDAELTRFADEVARAAGADHRGEPGAGAVGGVGLAVPTTWSSNPSSASTRSIPGAGIDADYAWADLEPDRSQHVRGG